MYSVNRLRLLVELRRRGTLGAVAEALHFSASTVSQQLSRLEGEVGVRLFEPAGRRVRLTAQAQVLADHAERILADLEGAKAAVARSMEQVTGTVRIASFQTGILHLVSPLLRTLAQSHPGITAEVVQAESEPALEHLAAFAYDLAIIEEYPHRRLPSSPDLDTRPLLADPMLLVLPRAEADALGAHPGADELWRCANTLGWAMEPRGSVAREWAVDTCREAGFEPMVRLVTDDLLVQRQMVADGHAAALLPTMLGVSDDAGVRAFPLPGGAQHRQVLTAVRASAAEAPAIATCRAVLEAQCGAGAGTAGESD